MIVEHVETRPVVIRLAKPIGSALGELREFGCILVSVRPTGWSARTSSSRSTTTARRSCAR